MLRSSWLVPTLLALPWIIVPLVALWRARESTSLNDFDAATPPGADVQLVSVIIPARNEAANLARCVASVRATGWPRTEIIVVDDHSTDGTGGIARAAAAGDPRVRVIVPPGLPAGWFGKQWACHWGGLESQGDILCFTDADTWHAPGLVPRAVNALHATGAGLLSVMGRQEMESFWERLIQPQVFGFLMLRYGGAGQITRSRRREDKIANGQFMLFPRDVYVAVGGHASVRQYAAEDLMLAQRTFGLGREVVMIPGVRQLSTRMYASLAELVRGWGKNVYSAGRHGVMFGALGRAVFPAVLLAVPLLVLLPPLALVPAAAGLLGEGVLLWALVATAASLLYWFWIYAAAGASPWYAALYPLGQAVLLYIIAGAVLRGRRVRWKAREYVAE